jgi:hypothetical protein
MPVISSLVVRDDSSTSSSNLTPTMLKLLIALLVLFVLTTFLVTALLILRCVRRSRYNSACSAREKLPSSNYKRLTVDTTSTTPAYVIQEKRNLIDNSSSPPPSPLPEIRITFPDEVDDKTGCPQSGRVVVVRMGDNSAIGLEPLEDQLPPYEKNAGGRFESLDLDRMGGLKEKELDKRYG